MLLFKIQLSLFVLLALIATRITAAFDTEELEIFDLVEDINENFYDLLGVHQVNEFYFYGFYGFF